MPSGGRPARAEAGKNNLHDDVMCRRWCLLPAWITHCFSPAGKRSEKTRDGAPPGDGDVKTRHQCAASSSAPNEPNDKSRGDVLMSSSDVNSLGPFVVEGLTTSSQDSTGSDKPEAYAWTRRPTSWHASPRRDGRRAGRPTRKVERSPSANSNNGPDSPSPLRPLTPERLSDRAPSIGSPAEATSSVEIVHVTLGSDITQPQPAVSGASLSGGEGQRSTGSREVPAGHNHRSESTRVIRATRDAVSCQRGAGRGRCCDPGSHNGVWGPSDVGREYVFESDRVPALLEVFTSIAAPDYRRVQRLLNTWFATSAGMEMISPHFVPVVMHVDMHNSPSLKDRDGEEKYTQRLQRYRNEWEQDLTHANEEYSGLGSCTVRNGEYVPLADVESLHPTTFAGARSPGTLKVTIASSDSLFCAFEPLPSCQHMIGQLYATIAIVGCGSDCTYNGHVVLPDSHHSKVLSLEQVPLVKQDVEGVCRHVAEASMSTAGLKKPDMLNVAHGIVVWVLHGFIDTTPIAVGHCGFNSGR